MTILPQPIDTDQPRPTNQLNLVIMYAAVATTNDVRWQCKCRQCGSCVLYSGRYLSRVRVKYCRECSEVAASQEAELWAVLGIDALD